MDLSYLDCPYEDFPYSEKTGQGMKTIDADFSDPFVRTETHVVYREADGKQLMLNIMYPAEAEGLPLVLYVRGSAFHKQEIDHGLAWLAHYARRGYVTAMAEYRESDIAPFPAQAIDIKYAVQYLVEHAEGFGYDPSKLVLWGDSSGAHTVLMAAFTAGLEDFTAPDLREYPIAGVVDYYGPISFSYMQDEPSAVRHIGADSPEGYELGRVEVTRESARVADVREYVAGTTMPVLIVHGDRDRQVPFGQSCMLNDALIDAGRDVEFYRLHGADHGGAPFWNAAVLDIVDSFMRGCLER